MDFIRNLFALFQRLQDIIRDGQKRGDMPGMAMALLREVRGGDRDADGQGDGPAVYQGRRAHADQGTPSAASRATARNKTARDTDLPEPASARPLQREEYDYQPASADPSDIPAVPEPVRGEEPDPEPETEAQSQPKPQPAPVAAAAPAAAAVIWDYDEDDGKAGETDPGARAILLQPGAEPMVEYDRATKRTDAGTVEGAAAVATALPTSGEDAGAPARTAPAAQPQRAQQVEIIPADPRNPATQPASQTLANPGIRLYGTLNAEMYAEFTEQLFEQEPGGPIVIALTTMEGDPEIARSMADDIRLLRDRGRREIIFLGKTAVHGAGVLFMAAFPVSHRYLTRATKVLITENKRAQPIQLAGGSLRSVASQLEHVQREIQREIEQEDEDYRAISEGSNVSVQELREKAPNEWFITASEAKAMGLIAEVV